MKIGNIKIEKKYMKVEQTSVRSGEGVILLMLNNY